MAIQVVDIIDERHGRILLVKKGQRWLLPGGVIEKGENEIDCLRRELGRELGSDISKVKGKLDKVFQGTHPVSNVQFEVSVVLGDISSKHMADANEHGAGWFSRKAISKMNLSDITKQILEYYFKANQGGH